MRKFFAAADLPRGRTDFGAGAQAEETACTGVLTGVVAGDVVVPSGSTCTLEQAEISGTVTVEPEGRLWGNAVIGGGIELRAGARLAMSDSMISGDVVCRRCQAMSMMFMYGIGGDLRVTGMTDGYISWDGVPSRAA